MSCICQACGQQIQEQPPRPLDLIDQLYLAHGKCCAGCDFWQHDPGRTKPMGYCHKQPTGQLKGFDIEHPGSITESQTYKVTDARDLCGAFRDTFDWTQLGVENPSWRDSRC